MPRTKPVDLDNRDIVNSAQKIVNAARNFAALVERREAVATGPSARAAVPARAALSRPVRQLHGASALLAVSVLVDSAIEHYRGSFENPAMVAPLISSAMNIIASSHGMAAGMAEDDKRRQIAYGGSIAVGMMGAGFHVYNILKRVGGFRWENLFYGAPIGAPAALALSGLAGLAADRIAATRKAGEPKLLGLPAGRVAAAAASVGLMGTVGEAGLMHFRGAFHNPAMFLPVSLPPVAAVILADAAIRPSARPRRMARLWLGATSVLGFAGVGFHCYGVSRAMGGWKNWRQNVIDGPPIPAPPSFSGLALAGLAALALIERASK